MSRDSLGTAIMLLEGEVAALGSPPENTPNWYLLRGKSTGLSLLKALMQQGLFVSPTAVEDFRKDLRIQLTKLGEPPVEQPSGV